MAVFGRASAVSFVGLVAVVACTVAIESSTTTQPSITFGSNTVFTTSVNGSMAMQIAISPANDKISSSDRITAITTVEPCPEWKLNLSPLPTTVINSCGSASGSTIEPALGSACVAVPYTFMPEFSPSDPGTTSCTLKIDTDTGSQSLTLIGVAAPLPVDLRLATGFTDLVGCNPCSAKFGDVDVLGTSITTLEVRNAGSTNATITKITTSDAMFQLVGGDPGTITLQPGETQNLQVQCAPSAPTGVVAGTLVIDSDNQNDQVAQTLAMTCRGIQSDLQFLSNVTAISQIDLTTRVHEEKTASVFLKNKGSATMVVTDFVVSVPNSDLTLDKTPPFSIAPGSQTALMVRFAPTDPLVDLGKLTVKFDAGERDLALTGGALVTTIETVLDPPSLGKLCIGDRRTVKITARATGEGGIRLADIDATDPDHDPFELVVDQANPLPFQLEGNRRNEVKFTIAATPTTVQNMSIVLNTDLPREGATSTAVVVDLPAEVLPEGIAGPESVIFQAVDLGTEAFARAIEISNCTDTAVAIDGVALSNDNFELVAGDFQEIPPRMTVTYQVAMKTAVPGAKVASLVVRTTDDAVTVPLSGEVLGAEARDSYYACSSSSPGGWLLMIGILGLVLKRRS